MEPDQRITEARARIIWGEATSSVREFLISSGMPETDADAKIREFNIERTREIRGIGLKNTFVGAGLLGVAGFAIYLVAPLCGSSAYGRVLAFLVLGAFYGLWKLMKGIIYLARPQSEHKAISDIDE